MHRRFESSVYMLSSLGLEVGQGICFHFYPLSISKKKKKKKKNKVHVLFKSVFNLLNG
jgi:hypothetical protein